MRAAVFVLSVLGLGSGCGVALDFDPPDPDLGSGVGVDAGGPRPDLGARDSGAASDLGPPPVDGGSMRDGGMSTEAGSGDAGTSDGGMSFEAGGGEAGTSDGGVSLEGGAIEAGTGDAGGVRSCFTNTDCRITAMEFCQLPDGVCGGSGVCAVRPGGCTALFAPVCGCDDNDYSNPCLAHAAGTNVAFSAMCGTFVDGGTDPCGFIATLDRSCGSDSSCAVGIHQSDCCGSTVAIGFNHTEASLFSALEPGCAASYPTCGCAAGPLTTDSGEVSLDATSIRVACVARGPAMICMTYVTMRPPDGP